MRDVPTHYWQHARSVQDISQVFVCLYVFCLSCVCVHVCVCAHCIALVVCGSELQWYSAVGVCQGSESSLQLLLSVFASFAPCLIEVAAYIIDKQSIACGALPLEAWGAALMPMVQPPRNALAVTLPSVQKLCIHCPARISHSLLRQSTVLIPTSSRKAAFNFATWPLHPSRRALRLLRANGEPSVAL